ncbi:UNVERIFIED_CONTAM: hypothetical protein FKN15_013430, partial [Acipenser sinensis]
RSKGAILNISSASGMYPVPLLTLYSSTKAFVDFFSRAMHAEYKSRGIIVQSVLPFFVATKLSKIRRPTLDKPSPEAYVKAALSTVGLQVQTNGYLLHALMPVLSGQIGLQNGVLWLRLIPSFLPVSEADWMFAQLLADLPWKQKSNLLHGESYEEPRLTCWFGELPYTYSHSTLQPNTQWHPVLAELRQRVELASGHSFNSLLCNLYRDGKDSIAWHSDSEPSLRPRPTIGSLSLGDTRNFKMRKQPAAEEDRDYTYTERIRVPLSHGTLLLMEGAVQEDWQD